MKHLKHDQPATDRLRYMRWYLRDFSWLELDEK